MARSFGKLSYWAGFIRENGDAFHYVRNSNLSPVHRDINRGNCGAIAGNFLKSIRRKFVDYNLENSVSVRQDS